MLTSGEELSRPGQQPLQKREARAGLKDRPGGFGERQCAPGPEQLCTLLLETPGMQSPDHCLLSSISCVCSDISPKAERACVLPTKMQQIPQGQCSSPVTWPTAAHVSV